MNGGLNKSHLIANTDRAASYHRSVHACIVLIETHDCLHYACILFSGLRIQVDYHAAQIAHCNLYGWPWIAVTEHQHPPDPPILEKRFAGLRLNYDVGSEPSPIELESGLAADACNGRQADYRDCRLVEDPMIEFHEVDTTPQETGELGLQQGTS